MNDWRQDYKPYDPSEDDGEDDDVNEFDYNASFTLTAKGKKLAEAIIGGDKSKIQLLVDLGARRERYGFSSKTNGLCPGCGCGNIDQSVNNLKREQPYCEDCDIMEEIFGDRVGEI